MDRDATTEIRHPSPLRQRVVLKTVDAADAHGLVVPPTLRGTVAYRGPGAHDYACERCGSLLAIGVRHKRMFRTLVFGCHCGALNKVA